MRKNKQFRPKVERYTIGQFHAQFPDDAAVLAHIFTNRYPNGLTCEKCGRENKFTPVAGRRAYACNCGAQVYPTANTIFHKSTTSLKTRYLAMFYMAASKNGVAALELQRHIGVTYKCAWRMMHQIRKLMAESVPTMRGTVEVDETFVGGYRRGQGGRGAAGKTPVIGLVERGGNAVTKVVASADAATILPIIAKNVDAADTKVVTDEYSAYRPLKKAGFDHEKINHSKEEWARGDVHTNSIEGFWSQMKRSIDGTHHHVARKYLQAYANEYSFRFNRRRSDAPMFVHLVGQLAERPF